MAAKAGFVVGGGEGGGDLGELKHHCDVKGPDAGELDAKGEFGLGEGGHGEGGGEGGDVEVGGDFAAFEAGGGTIAGVLDVGGDLRRVRHGGAEAVGEGCGALDGGADADFVADGGAEMEYSGNGDASAGYACREKLLGVRKGVYFFDGGNGGRELEVCSEVFGLALEGE